MSHSRTASEAIAEARSRMTFEQLISHLGFATGKKAPCPFCQKKGSSGLFNKVQGVTIDRPRFKCFKTSCAASDAMDEVQFIAVKMGLETREAFKEFLRIAGVK